VSAMRKVTTAKRESCSKFAYGYLSGSQIRWTLTLDCGHEATRYDRSRKLKEPTRARCRVCEEVPAAGGGESVRGYCQAMNGAWQCEKRAGHDGDHVSWASRSGTIRWDR
jgi:hypothetical protein